VFSLIATLLAQNAAEGNRKRVVRKEVSGKNGKVKVGNGAQKRQVALLYLSTVNNN
jgi:hypothetical protein